MAYGAEVVPVVGGVIAGGVDAGLTHTAGLAAISLFFPQLAADAAELVAALPPPPPPPVAPAEEGEGAYAPDPRSDQSASSVRSALAATVLRSRPLDRRWAMAVRSADPSEALCGPA
eukprot:1194881-Prorocentrum_minimum.AAC.3